MSVAADVAWIAVDWGTTNLRIWALDANHTPLAHRCSDKGMSALEPTDFENALLELIGDFLSDDCKIAVVVCGMAGSRQGWREAPYVTVPCGPPGIAEATRFLSSDKRLEVSILPGVKQLAPPDVMRGEETQIAGLLAERPAFSGVLCLPGTHTKWVALENGVITSFRTAMTGEVFALLSNQSVLQHNVSRDQFDEAAFAEAVLLMSERPEDLTSELFGIRASCLVADLSPNAARGRLSGLLIGAELAAMKSMFNQNTIALLGSDAVAKAYAAALLACGYQPDVLDADAVTLKGLVKAYQTHLKETA